MQPLDPSLVRFRAVVEGALAALEARRQEINDLNVFPVADGDTGDNMALTLRAVVDELARLADEGPIDEIGRDADRRVGRPRRAARRARQLRRDPLPAGPRRRRGADLAARASSSTPTLVAAALAQAADRAYRSVREPAEGTILTVAREMATRMASELAHMPGERAAPGGDGRRASCRTS